MALAGNRISLSHPLYRLEGGCVVRFVRGIFVFLLSLCSLPLSLCLSLYVSLSLSICLSLYICLSLSLCLSLSICLSLLPGVLHEGVQLGGLDGLDGGRVAGVASIFLCLSLTLCLF